MAEIKKNFKKLKMQTEFADAQICITLRNNYGQWGGG